MNSMSGDKLVKDSKIIFSAAVLRCLNVKFVTVYSTVQSQILDFPCDKRTEHSKRTLFDMKRLKLKPNFISPIKLLKHGSQSTAHPSLYHQTEAMSPS